MIFGYNILYKVSTSRRFMKYKKIILILIAGIMMVGQGSRMILEGILRDKYYQPNTFDIFFDWSTLFFIGVIMLFWGTYLFYNKFKKGQHY